MECDEQRVGEDCVCLDGIWDNKGVHKDCEYKCPKYSNSPDDCSWPGCEGKVELEMNVIVQMFAMITKP